MTRLIPDQSRCDLFENGGEGDCGGPTFTDPQPEGIDLKVCAFHTLMNRNEWMARALKAEAVAKQYMAAYGLEDRER